MTDTRLLVVIPTRNRSGLAIRAAKSALLPNTSEIRVLISDNSTDGAHASALQSGVDEISDPRLMYVRPPEPLAMAAHWEWAIRYALEVTPLTHIAYLTDRFVYKREALRSLLEITGTHDRSLIVYVNDTVLDHVVPVHLAQAPWSGRLVEVDCRALLSIVANGTAWFPALPRMLNCIVPVDVIRRLRDLSGEVFGSVAPDYNFGFSYLGLFDSYVLYDRAAIVQYGLAYSNGFAFLRGVMNDAQRDFVETSGLEDVRLQVLVPEVRWGINWVFHEYNRLRQTLGEDRFPELNRAVYLDTVGRGLLAVEDTEERQRALAMLRGYGWIPSARKRNVLSWVLSRRHLCAWRVIERLMDLTAIPATQRFWNWAADNVHLTPWNAEGFVFQDSDAALHFASRFERRRTRCLDQTAIPGAAVHRMLESPVIRKPSQRWARQSGV